MKTITDAFKAFKEGLSGLYDDREIASVSLIVLTEVINSSSATIKAFGDRPLTFVQQQKINDILTQLKTGKPLQYVLGYTEFYGLKFLVNPATLIPRPETEELVEWVLDSVAGDGTPDSGLRVLDIGTGSGCIAISLKKNLPGTDVSAIDFSVDALNTAKKNAKLHEVEVNFIEADILNYSSNASYSIIVSNPPYVTLEDKKRMHRNVTNFEPHSALFVPEDDPLIFYRAIADFALKSLEPNGLLFFEINESLGKETAGLLESKGFKDVELKQDLSGRDRMIKATR
ncbi:peptide chain release factor N(5)-glutamine methyltransferase [Mucilaginibacter sp. dw_454]|uniref:peptide chain release factor N(5)-glutamine methyltransferase n=1 Tax=Mucilaginibacter sp. dw_454 TaxID=2720079 RepID=UPI001BD6B642|nr:peptide chain release factor N(5)-glutamine methyltransferase [Mucilaginibacter sp. dw_454]